MLFLDFPYINIVFFWRVVYSYSKNNKYKLVLFQAMPYEITEIKTIRKKLGLTQAELAKQSGVSQSLIAKIESGRIDPAYSRVKSIFTFFDRLKEKKGLMSGQAMRTSVFSIGPESKITEAIKMMRKHSISQMPVMSKGRCEGFVSETIILDSILHKKAAKVKDIMGDPPPIVPKSTPLEAVSEFLRHVPLVLIAEKGRIIGVITKSDILGKINQ